MTARRTIPLLLLLAAGLAPLAPPNAQAGPLLRRAQERKACQEFAVKLQTASANPQQAQLVYQQGVLKLVATFGENPCGDIPAPTAAAPATPAPAPLTAPFKVSQVGRPLPITLYVAPLAIFKLPATRPHCEGYSKASKEKNASFR